MKRSVLGLTLNLSLALTSLAATPTPDQLLPADTLAVFTVPDYAKAKVETDQWPMNLLWNDPALKPFRDKLETKVKTDLIQPLEKELGISLDNYCDLVQGQLTFAVTRNGWDVEGGNEPAFLFLLDAKTKSEDLKSSLTELKQKWRDSGKQLKPVTIRNVEFATLIFSTDDFSEAMETVFPDPSAGHETLGPPKAKKPGKKLEWIIGQSESVLILGNSAEAIEKILVRQSGGEVPSLRENDRFTERYAGDFRDALSYGWVDLRTIFDVLTREMAAKAEANPAQGSAGLRGDKIMDALGLNSLTCLALSTRGMTEGALVDVFVGAPAAQRKGLAKLVSFESKDATPPSFVPAEATKFSRWRLDLKQVVNTLEGMIFEAAPQYAGIIKMVMESVGKDKDPNFNLRENLIGNLGDDSVSFEKTPAGRSFLDLNSPPSLVLLGSPRAEQLAGAIKALTALLPTKVSVKERDFLGRKIYSLPLPTAPMPGATGPVERSIHFAASGGYIAISTHEPMLDEYLRSSSGSGKSLKETPGLAMAADKVGGMGTGMFGFENQRETARVVVETLKQESGTLSSLLSLTPLAMRLGIDDEENTLKDWVDFSLLPPFDQIAKYFGIMVWAGKMNAEGLNFKIFTPHPPEMRK